MTRPVSQAELARLAGVSEMAVSKACRKSLSAARVGKRVDLDHPAVQRYVERAQKRKSSAAPKATRPPRAAPSQPSTGAANAPPPAPSAPTVEEPGTPSRRKRRLEIETHVIEDAGALGDLTIREVVKRFGTVTGFKDWLTALKQIEDIREKRLRNEEADGRLIPREPVRTYVFAAIDAVFRRLLHDAPKTIARRAYAMSQSSEPIEDAERMIREVIGSQLRPMKQQTAKHLRNGEA